MSLSTIGVAVLSLTVGILVVDLYVLRRIVDGQRKLIEALRDRIEIDAELLWERDSK